MMKSTDPQFGDENVFSFHPYTESLSKNYYLSNGASFTLEMEYNEEQRTYLIEVKDIKGNFKDFRFSKTPENVIICKESMYKYECMVLSNSEGAASTSVITLNFVVFFNLQPKPISTNSAHNQVFKYGLFRSLSSFDEYIEFYIRSPGNPGHAGGNQKFYCIMRKVFVVNDLDKSSYSIYFNWNNREGHERRDKISIIEMNTEKFMIFRKTPMDETESKCFKMLEAVIKDNIIFSSNRKPSIS